MIIKAFLTTKVLAFFSIHALFSQMTSAEVDLKQYGKEFSGNYFPELRNGLDQKLDHEIPLGPIAGKALVLYEKKEATITELWPKGPGAKAGLKVGDRIVKLNNKRFNAYSKEAGGEPKGVPEALGHAIIDSQASGSPLIFGLNRNGKNLTVDVDLPKLPAFSKKFSTDCPRTKLQIKLAANYLAKIQKKDGSWIVQDYANAWNALALLATGDSKYKPHIKRAAQRFNKKYKMKPNPTKKELISRLGGLDNWRHAMVGIFLAEYYLATGDKSVLSTIKTCCRRLEARIQPQTGRLGHQDIKLAYGGFGLVIINTQAHILWGLTAQIQDLEWDWEPWELSMRAVKDAIRTAGAVGYSKASPGQKQSGARSGSMATGLALVNRDKKMLRDMGKWLSENHRQFPDTHSMTSLGLVYGFMGLKNAKPKEIPGCHEDYRWMYALTTPPNSNAGVYYYACRHNHVGDKYLKKEQVGNWVTILTLSAHKNDTLWCFGNRKKNWYK